MSVETEDLLDLPTDVLLERFGSAEPAPGGGSAAALAGALAGNLARMVALLTVGKKNYEAVSDEAERLAGQAQAIADQLASAVEEDARSFDAVMAAMALPKATESEKAARREAMQEAFKGATLVPLATAKSCLEAGRLALRLLAIGNQNTSTDAGVAVLMAVAGAEGALFNVAINLGSIKDEAWLQARRAEIDPLWKALETLRAELWPAMKSAGVEVPR